MQAKAVFSYTNFPSTRPQRDRGPPKDSPLTTTTKAVITFDPKYWPSYRRCYLLSWLDTPIVALSRRSSLSWELNTWPASGAVLSFRCNETLPYSTATKNCDDVLSGKSCDELRSSPMVVRLSNSSRSWRWSMLLDKYSPAHHILVNDQNVRQYVCWTEWNHRECPGITGYSHVFQNQGRRSCFGHADGLLRWAFQWKESCEQTLTIDWWTGGSLTTVRLDRNHRNDWQNATGFHGPLGQKRNSLSQ
jgi:hypothetical protein